MSGDTGIYLQFRYHFGIYHYKIGVSSTEEKSFDSNRIQKRVYYVRWVKRKILFKLYLRRVTQKIGYLIT